MAFTAKKNDLTLDEVLAHSLKLRPPVIKEVLGVDKFDGSTLRL